ncbi:MAG: GNAT family N-acetyltransferase [Acidimicrobiaceae bacterium]|nr:GNAT family N-acetyltransferase [Acidimicrobiaceae bacterium]
MSGGASPEGSAAPMVLPVPDLAGPTTQLRRWRVTDAPALAAAWRDPVIRDRLSVPEPADEASAASWISQRERAWADGVSIDLAVTDPPSGTVIGEVGLSQLDPVRRAALVGWWIAQDWRGQGRAGEAVRLVVDWALSEGPLEAVIAEIGEDNPASAAVARRAGLRRVDASRRAARKSSDVTLLVFARTRTDAP